MAGPESPARYRFIFPPENPGIHEEIAQTLIKTGHIVERGEIPGGWVFIPPDGWVLLLSGDDMAVAKPNSGLIPRILEFNAVHPGGLVVFSRYMRLGAKKRQEIERAFLALITATDGGISGLIPTRNDVDTVTCLELLAKRVQIEDLDPTLGRVGGKKAYIFQAQIELLEGLVNCGTKKAEELLTAFDSPWAVFDAILNDPEKISAMRGFGDKFVQQNRRILRDFFSHHAT